MPLTPSCLRAVFGSPRRRLATEWAIKHRLRLRDELLLAVLPTVTVLLVLGLVRVLGRQHLLCATLASSAMLIFLDPTHKTNTVRTLVLAQMGAALVGWSLCSLFGPGFMAAGASMTVTILLMILFDAVHPPAASTALAFSLRLGENSSLVIFGLAVGITAILVLLQRVVLWFVNRRSAALADLE
jgi:CBS-domain-containing membrane protein